ncbi:site-specific integrase [Vibrio parahaemolyticus]|uniref:site-specific integrase n=1 Tax=Vibrio parahaemolyticus TaxID=670 RepID=UPI001864A710|nr:site-specific integrase [Vibrio parahaemolyticus]
MMSNLALESTAKTALPSLKSPLKTSRDRYSFDINSDTWVLNKDVTISFQREVLSLDPEVHEGFRKSLARYAEELSASHTLNMYLRFQRMVRDTGCKSIDEHVVRNWRAMLDDEHEWYLGSLRGFLISWYDYGYSGISSQVVRVLEGMRLAGNKKGVAIANRCPYTGALTQNEQVAVANELIRLFSKDRISLPCYSYLSLLQATARRSVQLRQLKAVDLLKERDSETKAVNYYLNIPRSKQRGIGFRGAFKKLAITEELYLTLLNLIEQEQDKLSKLYGGELTERQKELTPLFIDWSTTEDILRQVLNENTDIGALDGLLSTDVMHISTAQMRDDFMRRVRLLNEAISERTGDIIQLSARRFRRTRGTNLGRKGVSEYIIAEALDQSDTQNVKVYVENTADTVTYIDKAIGKQLAPFAKAFKGEIIETVSDGERGNDPSACIPNTDNEVVGACGTNDFCVKGYESCYLCEKFRPLLDAPHEKFLDGLYAEKEARLKATKSEQYASTKDTLILAVEWVVQACAEMKESKEASL